MKDLVTATEGTRQVEMKEQAVARECMQELNEIHAAQTREDLGAEAKLNQLIRELETWLGKLEKIIHQRIQVPNLEVLYLIKLFQGVGIPLHRPYILLT